VTELPAGWLGKVNALNVGLAASAGEFVLFTDADVHFAPGLLRRAVAFALANRLDHLAAFPQLESDGFLLRACKLSFARQLLTFIRPWAVGDPTSRAYMGVGAFNLIRREALNRTAGLEWLRLEVGDDAGLGLMIKRSGGRSLLVFAGDALRLHWYRTLGQMARGSEKGFATVARCSPARGMIWSVLMLLLELAPVLLAALAAFGPTRWVVMPALVVIVAAILATIDLVRIGRNDWAGLVAALAFPLAAPILAAMFIRASVLGWRRGGVMWRGTLYRSADLRAGARIKFPW